MQIELRHTKGNRYLDMNNRYKDMEDDWTFCLDQERPGSRGRIGMQPCDAGSVAQHFVLTKQTVLASDNYPGCTYQ